jgi:hypothetical protein
MVEVHQEQVTAGYGFQPYLEKRGLGARQGASRCERGCACRQHRACVTATRAELAAEASLRSRRSARSGDACSSARPRRRGN